MNIMKCSRCDKTVPAGKLNTHTMKVLCHRCFTELLQGTHTADEFVTISDFPLLRH